MHDSLPPDVTYITPPRTYQESRLKNDVSQFARVRPGSFIAERDFSTFIASPRPTFIARGDVSGGAGATILDRREPLSDASDPVAEASSKRLQLLARKFAGDASREDIARIEILTGRLEALAPRTTQEDIAKLEEQVATVESIAAGLRAAREKFARE